MARDGEGRVLHYWWDVNVPSTIRRDPWAGPAIVSDPTGFEWRTQQHVFGRGHNGALEHWWYAPAAGVTHDTWSTA